MTTESIAVPSSRGEAGGAWRRLLLPRLTALEGVLRIREGGTEVTLGRSAPDGLAAAITVHRPRMWRRAALGGSVGAAEAYADGDWDADDLTALVQLFARNDDTLGRLEGGLALLRAPLERAAHALRRNTHRGASRNIAAHYDLGNEFFELMLDPSLTYSCAIFPRPDASLEEASIHKLDLLCKKLDLRPSDHLVEIGTGWGSMAIHAAQQYGCRVTTTTISRNQHELATERVLQAGLQDRVTVLLRDYRDLTGRYDKLVSVEMIEAVGAEYYPAFFARCAALLLPGGRAAIQAITMTDQKYDRARREVDFVKRHVFPGSCIPSVTALLAAATRASDLRLTHLEDFTPHYARTLATWRANLDLRREAAERFGDPWFHRMWRYYLCYCEGGFRERYTGLVQMVMARPGRAGEA
jgi:cyclopropane-fatty-acyl-phospholipid synthase